MPSLRPVLLAGAALLALAACRKGGADEAETRPAAPANVAGPAPTPAPAPAPAPAPVVAAALSEHRRTLREEKDGAAEIDTAPEYEGARSAATALPSQGDDAPASPRETPASASPPPPPPGQPPG